MTTPKRDLPDFKDPPVIEVALSVQFIPLTKLRTPQLGLLWADFRDRLPVVEEHPPLEEVTERFDPSAFAQTSMRIQLMPPMPRCWFVNEAGSELIQVQQNRFIHNWRKTGEGDFYPRYEPIRDAFQKNLVDFCKFLERENLGGMSANQCEITYVNHMPAGAGWERHGEVEKILTVWQGQYSDGFLKEPENVRLGWKYVMPDDQGQPAGRLHVTFDPANLNKDGKPIHVLQLTARGKPRGEGIDGVFGFLDLGRNWIVRGFTSMTTPHMHRIWGRTR